MIPPARRIRWTLLAATSLLGPAAAGADAARWNPRITDWSLAPAPAIGDWGFDRPGWPKGLYIQGITVKDGEPVPNPVIYDNDVYDDVFDDEWAFAMVGLGRMNLVGLISTPVLTDGWGFGHPEWKRSAHEARERAIASGIPAARLPPIAIGTEADREKAGERKDSEGARLYVRLIHEGHRKDPTRPVLVNIGGQSATLASAHGIDPSIAGECIVYYTDLKVYNGHYRWASELVARHFRVVSWGDDNWWITKRGQDEWRVLPRAEKREGAENGPESGEWRLLTAMKVPMLDGMVHGFRNRGEYCRGDRKGDGYLDGTFIHAWLPGIFADAALREVRGGQVLHVTRFTEENEARVKDFTLKVLLDPAAYGRR